MKELLPYNKLLYELLLQQLHNKYGRTRTYFSTVEMLLGPIGWPNIILEV